MARFYCRPIVFSIAAGMLILTGRTSFAQGTTKAKEQQPAEQKRKSNPESDLENAAKNYVEQRKQGEGEAARQRAIADEQRAIAEKQKMEADRQRAKAAEEIHILKTELELAKKVARDSVGSVAPKSMFAITVWAVRLIDSDKDKNGDESKNSVPARMEFPIEFASADGVRALINGLADSGRVRSSRELRLIALDGQQVQVQIGANKPKVTGVNVTNMGRSNMLQYKSFGTTVKATPRLDSDKRIQISFEYNMSDAEPSNDVSVFETSEGKSKVTAEAEIVHAVETNAKLKNGGAVMVKCDVFNNSAGATPARQTDLLILGCETVPAAE